MGARIFFPFRSRIMFSLFTIREFRERLAESHGGTLCSEKISFAADVLVFAFFVGFAFIPSFFWKDVVVPLCATLFVVARFLREPRSFFQFQRRDWIFVGAIATSVCLLFASEFIQIFKGLTDEVYLLRDLKNVARCSIAALVFSLFSKKAMPVCLLVTTLSLAVLAGIEYAETGSRVSLFEMNQNHISFLGLWLIFPALYFCGKFSCLKTWIGLVASVCSVAVVAFGGSRGAFCAALVALAFYVATSFFDENKIAAAKRKSIFAGTISVALITISLLPNLVMPRIAGDFFAKNDLPPPNLIDVEKISNGRTFIWECVWRGISESDPICGVGGHPSNFKSVPAMQAITAEARSPHNTTLSFWLKFGLLGLVASVIFQLSGIWKSLCDMSNRRTKSALLGALSIAFVVSGLFDTSVASTRYLFFSCYAFLFFAPIAQTQLTKKN